MKADSLTELERPIAAAEPVMVSRPLCIALAGNPNSGKTSLFNALTGLRYKVANYPGVTVEKREGALTLGEQTVVLLDLPGIYSFSEASPDESITSWALLGQIENERAPDVVLCAVDATNLTRNLFLVSQLIDLGLPMVIALTMSDVAEKGQVVVRTELLSRLLDVPVVAVAAPIGRGLGQLQDQIARVCKTRAVSSRSGAWINRPEFKKTIEELSQLETGKFSHRSGDMVLGCTLLSGARSCGHDDVKDAVVLAQEALRRISIDPLRYEAVQRYIWIRSVADQVTSRPAEPASGLAAKFDRFLTHPVGGVVCFVFLMALLFQSIFLWATIPMDYLSLALERFGNAVAGAMSEGPLRSLLVDGVIAGVGSVIVFIPQIAILFFFIGILEDSGYLARAAFLSDRVMRMAGLQGRSFIPLLSSFACAVPGVLATRTIPSFADRLVTILVAPLMSCSARIPVYSLLIAAFIPATLVFGVLSLQGLVMFGLYVLGLAGAACVALALKRFVAAGQPSLFVMEIPPLRVPSLRFVLRSMWDRLWIFLKSAGTIIVACSIVLWCLASYPQGGDRT